MKTLFLYINLLVMAFIAGTSLQSFAEKKYRYIKREHGVQFQGNIGGLFLETYRQATGDVANPPEISGEFKGSYSYNWKGVVEIGPYFGLDLGVYPFNFAGVQAGLKGEYNFIKNRGRRKFIPSIGLSAGFAGEKEGTNPMTRNLSLGAHVALKAFVAKRTAFVTNLGYELQTPFKGMFQTLYHNLDINMGFAYYFDFY